MQGAQNTKTETEITSPTLCPRVLKVHPFLPFPPSPSHSKLLAWQAKHTVAVVDPIAVFAMALFMVAGEALFRLSIITHARLIIVSILSLSLSLFVSLSLLRLYFLQSACSRRLETESLKKNLFTFIFEGNKEII